MGRHCHDEKLMTYVTCPIVRYHPAVVAQKAATMQLLSGGRFTLGLGAGENLNEHVVAGRWPVVDLRHQDRRRSGSRCRASGPAVWRASTPTS
jgi:alkanesulfonate monooxygenase SsuD/methylene tetrahydromethanopterin reductase-like flavin-dependent oxidoreductase (luciferase family)